MASDSKMHKNVHKMGAGERSTGEPSVALACCRLPSGTVTALWKEKVLRFVGKAAAAPPAVTPCVCGDATLGTWLAWVFATAIFDPGVEGIADDGAD